MKLSDQVLPSALLVVITLVFLAAERVKPGRTLPHSRGWYSRALLMNFLQLVMIGAGGLTWNQWFRSYSFIDFGNWSSPALEGLFYWFIGTFVFYWWHRLRHWRGFWRVFHQIHHSPSRIEVLTSFYKHPLEIAVDSILISFIIYTCLGGSAVAGAWYSVFAATGEYFYHGNIRTPHWMGYFIQRPELHSIHHQLDVHRYNFGDITWWDRLFGTFKDTENFVDPCGFHPGREQRLGEMLRFKDVY